ncbi:hypothetical protein LL560_003341 [Salmonella enterica]|nr:hypothetical protein [Salmonella enterica]
MIYIATEELRKFPAGGIWHAQLTMQAGQWHGGTGSEPSSWPGFMDAYWKADITLHITDNNKISASGCRSTMEVPPMLLCP